MSDKIMKELLIEKANNPCKQNLITDMIYAIYKKKPFTGDWFQADDREFTNYNECMKEAKKLCGVALIKRVKTTESGWVSVFN